MTADLLTMARAGDQEAFRQLVEPYRHHLQAALAIASSGPFTTRRTRLQETLLSAWLPGLGAALQERCLGPDVAVPGRHELLPEGAAFTTAEPERRQPSVLA